MKPTITLRENPIIFLKGLGGLVLLALLVFVIFSMIENKDAIPYTYLSFFLLIFFIIFIKSRKANLILNETGFEYTKGKQNIKSDWKDVDMIGIQTSRGLTVGFFIGIGKSKTAMIDFYALEKIENGITKRIHTKETCTLLENYLGRKLEFADHFLYGKSKNVKNILIFCLLLIISLIIGYSLYLL